MLSELSDLKRKQAAGQQTESGIAAALRPAFKSPTSKARTSDFASRMARFVVNERSVVGGVRALRAGPRLC